MVISTACGQERHADCESGVARAVRQQHPRALVIARRQREFGTGPGPGTRLNVATLTAWADLQQVRLEQRARRARKAGR
jgi:hypothetical protein